MGAHTIKSITAYRDTKVRDSQDLDGSPFSIIATQRFTDYRAFSQEMQPSGRTARFEYVVGAYYFSDRARTEDPLSFFGGSQAFNSRYASDTDAVAIFGQADYHATDQITLTAGLRYTREKKDIGRRLVLMPLNGSDSPPIQLIDIPQGSLPDAIYRTVTPTLIVTYELNENLTTYAKYARGFKSGGFNGESNSLEELRTPYRPEKADTYEIGLKGRLFDRRLQLNLAAFWNESKDIQLSVFTGRQAAESFVLNAARARIRGLEVEAVAALHDDVVIHATFAYLDPRYRSFIDSGVDVADNRAFPHAPKTTAMTSIDWTAWRSNTNEMRLNLIGDANHVSSYYTYPYALRAPAASDQIAARTRSSGRFIVDARTTLSGIPAGPTMLSASLWVRNLFDYEKPQNFIDFGPNFGGLVTAFYPDPRTYGVTLAATF